VKTDLLRLARGQGCLGKTAKPDYFFHSLIVFPLLIEINLNIYEYFWQGCLELHRICLGLNIEAVTNISPGLTMAPNRTIMLLSLYYQDWHLGYFLVVIVTHNSEIMPYCQTQPQDSFYYLISLSLKGHLKCDIKI